MSCFPTTILPSSRIPFHPFPSAFSLLPPPADLVSTVAAEVFTPKFGSVPSFCSDSLSLSALGITPLLAASFPPFPCPLISAPIVATITPPAVTTHENIKIECYPEQLTLRFPDPGNLHSVYLDGKEVWKGRNAIYTIDALESNTSYTVFIRDKTEATQAIFYIQTPVKPVDATEVESRVGESEVAKLDQQFQEGSLRVYVFPDRIELEIGFIPNDTGVLEIYRNGVKIGETVESRYVDYSATGEIEYEYEVHGKRKISETEFFTLQVKCIEQGIPLFEELLEELRYQDYSLGRCNILTNSQTLVERTTTASVAAAAKPAFLVRYATFIPWSTIWIPAGPSMHFHTDWHSRDRHGWGIHPHFPPYGVYTNGNGRGFSPLAARSNYKTIVDILATPGSGPRATEFFKETGKSREWHSCGLERLAKAPRDGMHFTKVGRFGESASWVYKHAVANPLHWASPAIDWDYIATVSKDGKWKVSATYNLTPSHEMYIVRKGYEGSASKWQTIFTNYSKGPDFGSFLSGLVRSRGVSRSGQLF